MAGVQKRKIQRAIYLLLVILYFYSMPAQAQYGGGTGEPNDPYQIARAEDLMMLGDSPEDYDKHFILTVDIDLDPNLPGRKVFRKAVIAPDNNPSNGGFRGTYFAGVFDGNGQTISHLTIVGKSYLGMFGLLGPGAKVSNLGLEAVNVRGTDIAAGGLAGRNFGSITTNYITGKVSGNENVGGLVGSNPGNLSNCYSTCMVSGTGVSVGGLVGSGGGSKSFWDIETSGQTTSAGGTGLTTAEMQDINTYLNAGWDFVDEIGNGTCDYWQISPGDYPRLRYHASDRPLMPEGLGTAQEPYLIRDARDLGTIWFKPSAHYSLEASLDLSGIIWSMAVVPWFEGTFDGNGYVIRNLNIEGGGYLGLFGQLISGAKISNLGLEAVDVNGTDDFVGGLVGRIGSWEISSGVLTNCYSTGTVTGGKKVGGMAGDNFGSIATSYSTCTVRGELYVGGLMGGNGISDHSTAGVVTNCYSIGMVTGNNYVGGLAGNNQGSIFTCYSTGKVTGSENVGGLVGKNWVNIVSSFWDIETSGQTISDGGTGKTTVEMQIASTFLEAGWDFVDETANGTEDIWWILEGQDYPMLRELTGGHRLGPVPAFCPEPQDGTTEIIQSTILSWVPRGVGLQYDVYFGEDEQAVANATTESEGIYCGRQLPEMTTYEPGYLEWGKTYYWRIDGVNKADPNSPWKGSVWSFTTANFLVVDDFESYNDIAPSDSESNRIFETWIDGYDDLYNGSLVGYEEPPFAEVIITHTGKESMSFHYDNSVGYSEATANVDNLAIGQDWTESGVETLSLWFYVRPGNAPEPMYVALANSSGSPAVVFHNNPYAAMIDTWTEWRIDLQEFANQGVDLTNINTISIGFGDKDNPVAGGSGTMYLDDIRLYRPEEPEPAP